MIEWVWPWLVLLAPLPWLVRRFVPPLESHAPALRAPFFGEWRQLSESQTRGPVGTSKLPLLTLWSIWLLLLIAAARPMWIGTAIELPNNGRDLMLAVDISGSMQIEDMQVNKSMVARIDAVKQVGSLFIERRKGDRLGLILFGSNAYVQSPLSFDTATVERFLLESQIGFAGRETAIGDAIGLAVKRLKGRPAQSRVLILLSDGKDSASKVQPLDAARLASELGIKIYTIGIGADRMTTPGLFGSSFGSRQVNPSADLDEPGLQKIAQMTGGEYFRARNPAELANIYLLLDELEPVEQATTRYRPRQALGYLPLALALALSFIVALRKLYRSGFTHRSSEVGEPPVETTL